MAIYLQLGFENEDKGRRLLHNVASLLKPGGYFFGITPDSSTIWYSPTTIKDPIVFFPLDLLFLEFITYIASCMQGFYFL